MQKLATSLRPLTGSSTESDSSTSQRQQKALYASERARLLFGQYRKGEANDPDTYVATVAAILAEYPADTIRYVTDPRTGIAANPIPDPDTGRVWTGMPNPAEVKRACEAHYGPERHRLDHEKRMQEQFAERDADRALADARPKKTYEELQAELAAVGIFIGGTKAKPSSFKVDDFLEQHGVSKADWDAIPNRGEYDDMLRRQGLKK